MISQGLELMLYGMGTVVVFLSLLVVSTYTMSRLIGRYFPESEASVEAALQRLHGQAQPADDPELVAVISAAIHRHRAR
jgi:oxaloacetate decarboxylase gamma subunit